MAAANTIWLFTGLFSHNNEAIVDSRFCPKWATHDVYLLIFTVQQNLVGIHAIVLAA